MIIRSSKVNNPTHINRKLKYYTYAYPNITAKIALLRGLNYALRATNYVLRATDYELRISTRFKCKIK